jgi:hypothetical protein
VEIIEIVRSFIKKFQGMPVFLSSHLCPGGPGRKEVHFDVVTSTNINFITYNVGYSYLGRARMIFPVT